MFTDTGTKASGEKLFEFTHRTFLEYFAAVYLCRNFATPKLLLEKLSKRIGADEWDMVVQLAFQLMSKQQEDASDNLILGLLNISDEQRMGPKLRQRVFAARTLQYLIPSPRARRLIAKTAVDGVITEAKRIRERLSAASSIGNARDHVHPQAVEALRAALRSDIENQKTVNEIIKNTLVDIQDDDQISTASHYDIVTVMRINFEHRTKGTRGEAAMFDEIKREFVSKNREKIVRAGRTFLSTGVLAACDQLLSPGDLIETFGWSVLNQSVGFLTVPDMSRRPLFDQLADVFIYGTESVDYSDRVKDICKKLGKYMIDQPPPWILRTRTAVGLHLESEFHQTRFVTQPERAPEPVFDSDQIYALFCGLALRLETDGEFQKKPDQIGRDKFSKKFQRTFAARLGKRDAEVREELMASGLLKEQQEIAYRWASAGMNFSLP